jgi:hypothetical protein
MKKLCVLFWILLFILAAVTLHISNTDFFVKVGYEPEPEEKLPTKSVEQIDSLASVYADLERKVEILNRYLMVKHIEYMEVCNLTYSPSKPLEYKHEH